MKLSTKLFIASFVSAATSLGAAYGADLVGKSTFLEFWLGAAALFSGIATLTLVFAGAYYAVEHDK